MKTDTPNKPSKQKSAGLASLTGLVKSDEIEALSQQGFDSVSKIARTGRAVFAKRLSKGVKQDEAERIHAIARAQNLLSDHFRAKGVARAEGAPASDEISAFSPDAYVKALLDWTGTILTVGEDHVTVEWLTETLFQPFAELVDSEEAQSEQILQVQMAVEVLRAYLNNAGPTPQALQEAYELILTNIGTSYAELRAAVNDSESERQSLADRLGIDASHLNQLFLKPDQLTEIALTNLFGLADTAVGAPDPTQPPSLQTWQEAYLRKQWLTNDFPPNAPATARAIVDPDLVEESYLVEGTNPAKTLWTERRTLINSRIAEYAAQGQSPEGLELILQIELGKTPQDLINLNGRLDEGYDIEEDLLKLHLALDAFLYLVRFIKLIEDDAQLLPSEWDQIYSILVQAFKEKNYPAWRTQEKAQSISISPDFFAFPVPDPAVFPPPIPPLPPAWRASLNLQVAWQMTLRGRIEQNSSVSSALEAAVEQTDSVGLPKLRDALLQQIPSTGDPAAWFSQRVQVDMTIVGTQHTTRTGLAIETLQGLLWSVRIGTLTGIFPDLAITSADAFDEGWQLMGSYGTWVSEVLVQVYPENYLAPGLRFWSTSAFNKLVQDSRTVAQLTSEGARQLARSYAAYLQEVADLLIEAGCQLPETVSAPAPYFMFARGRDSGVAYWCKSDPDSDPDYPLSPWDPIPGLPQTLRVCGAMPYSDDDGGGMLVLSVVIASGAQQIVLSRFRTGAGVFEPPVTLPLPQGVTRFSVVPVQYAFLEVPHEPNPLAIVLVDQQGAFWRAELSSATSSLNPAGWQKLDGMPSGASTLHAYVVDDDGASGTLWRTAWKNAQGTLTIQSQGSAPHPVEDYSFGAVWTFDPGAYVVLISDSLTPTKPYFISMKDPGQPVQVTGITRTPTSYATVFGLDARLNLPVSFGSPTGACQTVIQANGVLKAITESTLIAPHIVGRVVLTDDLSASKLLEYREFVEQQYLNNEDADGSVIEYLNEAFQYVAILLSSQLQTSGQYVSSLDWLKTVYDYTGDGTLATRHRASFSPLLADPRDVFRLTATEDEPLLRYKLISVIQCFLGYGDSEFGRDTAESVPRARSLYMQASVILEILKKTYEIPAGAPSEHDLRAIGERGAEVYRLRKVEAPLSVPMPFEYDVPPNPVVDALGQRIDLSLYKIRSGLNIGGIARDLDPYALPSNVGTGFPIIGGKGELNIPQAGFSPPTGYRYVALVERSKQLAQMAMQVESSVLSSLEKRDAETYNYMKATQDLAVSRATVVLQNMQVDMAMSNVALAQAGRQRAAISEGYYATQLANGLSQNEQMSLDLTTASVAMNALAAGSNFLAAALPSSIASGFPNLGEVAYSPQGSAMAVAAGFSSTAAALGAEATVLSTMASYERRNQEWQSQLSLSKQDVQIGDQQIAVAQDQVRINGQQLNIAKMQTDNAQATVNYLASKFTNASLYDWMAQVLQGVYQFFLQQATATAQTARRQLAFERQQMPPVEIQSDYWGAGGLAAPSAASGGNRGMTGAERLIQDIYNLDQWAFNTKALALQVTKSFSLMRLLPAEFEGLRKTGSMRFATPSALFDWDFPGHYLRTVRTVRVSVLALVPGIDGIKATLSSTGTSRVVVNSNGMFRPLVIKSLPQTVALTAARDANGVFDLQAVDPNQLLPFEGIGVDTGWRFDLARAANRMDYQSIADVIVTIEYRAYSDDNYRSQVIRSLGNVLSSDRPFSYRNDFADQWWQLCNPEQSETPMTVSFTLSRSDFPPNLDSLSVSQLVMSFTRADGETFEVNVESFTLTPEPGDPPIGGPAQTIGGLISTRRGNGSAWRPIAGHPPFGTWTLKLPDTPTARKWFADEKIVDILFSITYDALMPAWPA